MHCPRDAHALIQYADECGSLWRCDICSGAFVHSQAISEPAAQHAVAHRAQWDREIKCPADATPMGGLRYRHVTVDICAQCHGVWLDGDEIEKAVGRRLPGDSTFDLPKFLRSIISFTGAVIAFTMRLLV
jgi:ribosomal protein L31